MNKTKIIGLFAGIAVVLASAMLPPFDQMSAASRNTAAVTILMAIWWIAEPIPIYATALVPLVLFPLMGVLDAKSTAVNYGHDLVLMMISGFFIAKAIETHNLHKRIALMLLKVFGNSRAKILLSLMVATAILSMWIANITAALMMLPIGLSIIVQEESFSERQPKFGAAIMLGIAYAASIGGVATLIGSPTNLIYQGMMSSLFPAAPSFSFYSWLKIGIPVAVIFLFGVWYYIVRFFKLKGSIPESHEVVRRELASLGRMSYGEKSTLVIFLVTVVLWVFRENLVLGSFIIPGWSNLLGISEYVSDSTVGMFSALLLFMCSDGQGKRLLDWKTASKIPWGVGVIVGGGYALAEGYKSSGLAQWLGEQLAGVSTLPVFVMLLVVCGVILLFTEVNSNTATANIFLPVLAGIAVAGKVNPLLLMVPATFACSFVFIMPAGTGPNTVIFGSEKLTVQDMARCGIGLKLLSMIILPALLYFIIVVLMKMPAGLPAWAG